MCLQIPLLIPGQDISSPQRRWRAARRGFWDAFSGSPDGSQGQGRSCHAPEFSVWEGRGAVLQMAPTISRVAPAGLAEPSILCRHPVVLLCLTQAAQGASKIPLHTLPAMFRLHRGSGSPPCRILPEEEASCAQNPAGTCARDSAGTALRCCQCAPGLAGTTDPGMLLPASPPPPPPPPRPPPYLAGRGQGCCRRHWSRHPRGMSQPSRGHGAGSPAAGEALGEVPEHPMLRRPDWKRTRQACGSSWRLIPLCPGKRGGPGRESPFSELGGSQSDA